MLFTAYLNRRRGKVLWESLPLYVIADTLQEAQEKWAVRVRENIKSHGCGNIIVPDKVKIGWKAEQEPLYFSLTAVQPRQ